MKKEDEVELYRLTEMLKKIDGQLQPSSPYHEALVKGALHHVFIHGYRLEVEQQFDNIEKPLSAEDIVELRRLRVETDDKNKNT